MLPEVCVVGDSYTVLECIASVRFAKLTLLGREKSQLICRAGVKGIAFSVVSVF